MRRLTPALAAAVLFVAGCSDGRGDEPDVAQAPVEESGAPVVYAAVGTTETEANYLGFPESLRQSYAVLLHRESLPRRTVFFEIGNEEATVADALATQLAATLELEPTLVTVWLTSTDIEEDTPLDEYEDDLTELLAALQRGGEARVLVATSSQLLGSPAIDRRVEAAAEASGAEVVDLASVDLRVFDPDFPFPDAEDHELVAEAFAEVLGPLL